jgi:hypothetical protein
MTVGELRRDSPRTSGVKSASIWVNDNGGTRVEGIEKKEYLIMECH